MPEIPISELTDDQLRRLFTTAPDTPGLQEEAARRSVASADVPVGKALNPTDW